MKNAYELPPNQLSYWDHATVLGRNILASNHASQGGINFLSIPPAASRKPVSEWSIPKFPFQVSDFTAHLPEDMLGVIEVENQ